MNFERASAFVFVLILISVMTKTATGNETETFTCNFSNSANPEGFQKAESNFVLTFLVDFSSEKAYMIGNAGSVEVHLIPNAAEDALSFLEITATKNIMTTTIDKKLQVVHSRNNVMFGELIPSQYYGKCSKK